MQYEVTNPIAYLELLEEDWRKEKLEVVRSLILKHGPELEEGIRYKMLAYCTGDTPVFHLNAQKAYISLYVGNIDKLEKGRELLQGLALGKGCIRIKKSVNIENTQLEVFIKLVIGQYNIGDGLPCH